MGLGEASKRNRINHNNMEYSNILNQYAPAMTEQQVAEAVAAAKAAAAKNENTDV